MKCGACSKTFKHARTLTIHCRKIHFKELKKEIKCVICDILFHTDEHMKQHYSRVHIGGMSVKCDICNETFASKDILRTHGKIVHEEIKDFLCDFCEMKFSNRWNLQIHINGMHMKSVDSLQCKLCGKKYSKLGFYNFHLKIRHRNDSFQDTLDGQSTIESQKE